MFGHNEVVGQKFFRQHPEAQVGKLLVTSVFHTIQGEGPHVGQAAVFVRLAKCQLQCSFCDTYFDHGDWMTSDEILDAARRAVGLASFPSLLVITGGEPALQSDALAVQLGNLMTRSAFTRVQFETNGLLPIGISRGWLQTIVMSPKCAERAGKPTHYLQPNATALGRADCLKFLISGDPISPYYEVPDWAIAWRNNPRREAREIFVSPMAEYNHVPGATRLIYDARRAPDLSARTAAEKISFWEPNVLDLAKCRRNYEYAARYALMYDMRLSLQMHLFASLP